MKVGPNSRKTRREREFVEDAPLLLRRSTYRIDSDSREDLTEEETVVEYRLLPPGSSIPQLPYPQSTDGGRVVPGWLSKRSCASGFNGTRVGSPNIHSVNAWHSISCSRPRHRETIGAGPSVAIGVIHLSHGPSSTGAYRALIRRRSLAFRRPNGQ